MTAADAKTDREPLSKVPEPLQGPGLALVWPWTGSVLVQVSSGSGLILLRPGSDPAVTLLQNSFINKQTNKHLCFLIVFN